MREPHASRHTGKLATQPNCPLDGRVKDGGVIRRGAAKPVRGGGATGLDYLVASWVWGGVFCSKCLGTGDERSASASNEGCIDEVH